MQASEQEEADSKKEAKTAESLAVDQVRERGHYVTLYIYI
jgi:hypothetical protein